MVGNRIAARLAAAFLLVFSVLNSDSAQAGAFEVGGGFSLNRSNFANDSFTWTRRYTATIAYYITQDSQIEFMFQDTTTKTFVPGVQNIKFHDTVYSLDFVYYLFGSSMFSPFFRGGIGQLNRDATGSYEGGYSPPGTVDTVTGILGGGLRVRVSQRVAFKTEVNSYLTGGAIGTWQDNIAFSFGGSFFF